MTPKEKAEELVNKFWRLHPILHDRQPAKSLAKGSALIAVEEIIDALEEYDSRNGTDELQNMDRDFNYWLQVKEQIEKI